MGLSTCKIPVICGPTASGKTAVGIELAELVGGEIISMDSRQVYRGLDIGTAKATPEEQARAKHHLIDIADPGERFTVADFVKEAEAAIDDIVSRGKFPIIVGGTPFYLSALLEGYNFCEVDIDPDLRESLRGEAREKGGVALHEKLAELDPESARRIHPNDTYRVVRALEIVITTGKKVGEAVAKKGKSGGAGSNWEYRVFTIYMGRNYLYNLINKRVSEMYNSNLAGEIEKIKLEKPACRGFLNKIIGYGFGLDYVEGLIDLETAVEETRKQTRRFAKRQLTFLRSIDDVVRLNAEICSRVEMAAYIAENTV